MGWRSVARKEATPCLHLFGVHGLGFLRNVSEELGQRGRIAHGRRYLLGRSKIMEPTVS